MAFATKYKTSIMNWDGDTITAEIQEDLFTDTLEEFSPVGKVAIRIEHQTNVNVKESYIIPSKATIRMYVTDEWDMHDLLYATDRQFKVLIRNGSTVLFFGWLISGVNTEDYTTGQYAIKVTAIDGLADLKNIPYLDDGALYDAFQSPLDILHNIINKIELSPFAIHENTDIYAAAGMTTTTNTHSPLNQSFINTRAYGDTIDNTISSWDVLENLMQAFHCRFFQGTALSGTTKSWFMSKINLLGETTTYRRYSLGIYTAFNSYNPLLTMGTGINHVGGKAQLSIKQGYREIELTTDRGTEYNVLKGNNFEPSDFPTSSSLDNWGTLTKCKLVASWGTATIVQETLLGNEVCSLEPSTDFQNNASVTATDNGSGKVKITNAGHPIALNDWIMISEKSQYEGIWKVNSVSAGASFEIDADYRSDELTNGQAAGSDCYYYDVTNWKGIEANFLFPLANDVPFTDNEKQFVKIDFSFNVQNTITTPFNKFIVAVILIAWKSTTDYRVLNSSGDWIDRDALSIRPIITSFVNEGDGADVVLREISVTGGFGDAFFSAGTPKFYVSLMVMNDISAGGFVDRVSYNDIRVSFSGDGDTKTITAINSNFVNTLKTSFFHADGDGGDNDEYRFSHPIYDDATPKRFINSWQQDGGGADNLEDIIGANLAASYDENSQIWSGVIKGDINISNAITDPLNFNRTFQIQKIVRNLETDYCNISMIEISPNRGYVVEQIGDDGAGGTYYFLSKTYGDISASFTAATSYNISAILNKSTSAVLDSGGNRTPDGASSFVSGRVRILVSDGDYTGADVECKGILRIL